MGTKRPVATSDRDRLNRVIKVSEVTVESRSTAPSPAVVSVDAFEDATNEMIAAVWPLLDGGMDPGEVRAMFNNVLDSWEPDGGDMPAGIDWAAVADGMDDDDREFSAEHSVDPPIRLGLSDAPAMAARLAAAGIVSRDAALSLTVAERDRILGVAGWGGREDDAWAEALAGLPGGVTVFDEGRDRWVARVDATVSAAVTFEAACPGWKVESVSVNEFHEASALIVTPDGDALIARYDGDRFVLSDEWGEGLPHADRQSVTHVEDPARDLLGPVWTTYEQFGSFGMDEVNRRLDAGRAG